ncbi:MAG: glutaminyl-peptide cyclotransferase [Fluviicola sp.]|nr:glutaminyl-peptide cyclotransferase [Fluviicola sp.]
MKKYIIVGLIVFVGGFLLLKPLFSNKIIDVPVKDSPAVFLFKEHLATVRNQPISIEVKVNEELEKLEVVFNDSIIQTWTKPKGKMSFNFDPSPFGVGTKSLNLVATLQEGTTFTDNRLVRILSEIIPKKLTINELQSFPHLSSSFTQGLEFNKGRLFEGTGDPGNKGQTLVAEVNLKTGEHLQKLGLQAGYFGEGITILNDTLFQITWQNQKCYTYSVASDLQLVGEYNYTGEGWGLCNDGSSIIMSDGTERITFRDPKSFTTERTIEVYNHEGPIINLNELEFINGKIYANVWMTNMIVVIDPITGQVLQELDATEFVIINRGAGESLNGIAKDKTTGKIYLTGKYWNKIYEVDFVEPVL